MLSAGNGGLDWLCLIVISSTPKEDIEKCLKLGWLL